MCLSAMGREAWAVWVQRKRAPAECCWSAPMTAASVCATPRAACSCARWRVTPKLCSAWRWGNKTTSEHRYSSRRENCIYICISVKLWHSGKSLDFMTISWLLAGGKCFIKEFTTCLSCVHLTPFCFRWWMTWCSVAPVTLQSMLTTST